MLRLIKMYPDQVAKEWDKIGPAIEIALPPISDGVDRMNRVLESILSGVIQVHMFVDDQKVRGIVSTSIMNSIDGAEKQLLIYSLYGHKGITIDELREGFELLRELARGEECSHVVAYTSLDGLKNYVKRLGGDASQTFLRLEV